MNFARSLILTLIMVFLVLPCNGALYANDSLAPLTAEDTAPITQNDIDIFCQYCELVNARFRTPANITREKLARLWREAGWTENRGGVAVSRISTMYDALVENDATALDILDFMEPTWEEADLIIANQESLAHALSLLEKLELKF